MRSPISSMRVMMLSLICWNRDCICDSRFCTCVERSKRRGGRNNEGRRGMREGALGGGGDVTSGACYERGR